MGGCCCCPSGRTQLNEPPVYYYCPRNIEQHTRTTDTSLSTGLLVDTNPDTYQAPPAPLPYDVDLGRPRASSGILENSSDKVGVVQAADPQSIGEAISDGGLKTSVKIEDLKSSDCKNQTDGLQNSPKFSEIEPSKLSDPIVPTTNEEDICPTCLEEYDEENPRIITKCEHHFHLACILEWMERSHTCPICDQEMAYDHSLAQ